MVNAGVGTKEIWCKHLIGPHQVWRKMRLRSVLYVGGRLGVGGISVPIVGQPVSITYQHHLSTSTSRNYENELQEETREPHGVA